MDQSVHGVSVTVTEQTRRACNKATMMSSLARASSQCEVNHAAMRDDAISFHHCVLFARSMGWIFLLQIIFTLPF